MTDNPSYLTTQLITYIGNKRLLIADIENEILKIKKTLGVEKCVCADLFSGSGIVARMMKEHSSLLIANDLENYSRILNECYLSNKSDFEKVKDEYEKCRAEILNALENNKIEGLVTKNYAPSDTKNVKSGERCFYTHENAVRIDTIRAAIDKVTTAGVSTRSLSQSKGRSFERPVEATSGVSTGSTTDVTDLKKYFLAPLIVEASVHTNTSGVFKGFYKNRDTGIGCFGGKKGDALFRILGEIQLNPPILSDFECETKIYQKNAIDLASELKNIDIAYLDPPYNQHPYGSNYFMLNLIAENKMPDPTVNISKVSGIPENWNRSIFNKAKSALDAMEKIIAALNAKYILVSYNSEGFISFDEMKNMLAHYGKVETTAIKYNTFRGSRNLRNREIHVKEFIFTLKKSL